MIFPLDDNGHEHVLAASQNKMNSCLSLRSTLCSVSHDVLLSWWVLYQSKRECAPSWEERKMKLEFLVGDISQRKFISVSRAQLETASMYFRYSTVKNILKKDLTPTHTQTYSLRTKKSLTCNWSLNSLMLGVGADGCHDGRPCRDARGCSWKLPSTHLLVGVPFITHIHTHTQTHLCTLHLPLRNTHLLKSGYEIASALFLSMLCFGAFCFISKIHFQKQFRQRQLFKNQLFLSSFLIVLFLCVCSFIESTWILL